MKSRIRWIAGCLGAGLGLLLFAALLLPRLGINFYSLFNRTGFSGVSTRPGFEVSVFASGLESPRFITFGPDGVLYAAERGAGRIVALPDSDGDGAADSVRVFAADLPSPHSLVFYEGSLFIGVPDGVIRLEDADGDGQAEIAERLFEQNSPGSHSTRTVLFLPDGRMVVAKGSSCNVCEESDPFRAAVTVYDGPGGENPQLYAGGLRTAVGLTIQPETGALWSTNNGRDLMGDDLPPDTIDLVIEGGFYGWPFCHSGRIEDPIMGFPGACDGVIDPQVEVQAHSAPLGLVFYTGGMFPAAYSGDLFVAFHGSWNRSVPTGYKVVRIPFENGFPAGPVEDFVWGWLSAQGVSGRPVGLAVGPDGALYVSDDFGGRIYRVVYNP